MNDTIPHDLLQAYFDGTADDRKIAALSAWVEASPEHASYLNAMGWLDQALTQQLKHQAVDQMSDQERAFLDRVDPDAWELILESALSTKAEAQPLQLTEESQPPSKSPAPRIELHEVRDVIGYLLAEGLRKRPGLFVALAAMLILSTALFFVLTPGPTAPTQNITEQTPTTAPQTRQTPASARAAVATLTATHNAQWAEQPAEGALASGTKLHANQTLTLTAGFAEITTARGAVAILEAPATIELLDNNNAIRLQNGKLVGICETDSSKGLLVRTPHMDITDLGTEFGVHAYATGLETTVFTGEVEIKTHAGVTRRITTRQTATLTVNGKNRELVIDEQVAAGFDALRETQVLLSGRLPGSGEGLAEETLTSSWRITAISGKTLDSPLPLRVVSSFDANQPNDMAPARALRHNPTDGQVNAVYRIETTLRLPDGFDAEREQLAMRFRADNELTSLTVNGQAVAVIRQQTEVYGRKYTMVIDGPLKAGDNDLIFEVKNEGINNAENPMGLQVAWELQPVPAHQTEPTP